MGLGPAWTSETAPWGQKKPQELKDLRIPKHYKEWTYDAIVRLFEIGMGLKEGWSQQAQLVALMAYIDRSLGKPTQEIRATLEDRRPILVDQTLGDIVQRATAPEPNEMEVQRDGLAESVKHSEASSEVSETTAGEPEESEGGV
jgi:hypothetical protein